MTARRLAIVAALAVGLSALSASAVGAWQQSRTAAHSITAATFAPATAPVPELVGSPATTLTLRWTPSTIGGRAPTEYALTTYPSGSSTATSTASCAPDIAGGFVSCQVTVADGSWEFTEAPVYLGWTGTPSARSAVVTVATAVTVPAPVITFPANASVHSPSTWLAGCTTPDNICGTASQPSSGTLASVKLSLRHPNGNYWNGTGFTGTTEQFFTATGTTSWTFAWSSVSFPIDGTYTISVRSTSSTGVDSPATTHTFTKDSTGPVVAITGPSGNVSGTVTISATATDTPAGVASVQFQVRTGTAAFADVGAPDTSSPYETSWTTPSVNARYDIRAIATDTLGNTTTSAETNVNVKK